MQAAISPIAYFIADFFIKIYALEALQFQAVYMYKVNMPHEKFPHRPNYTSVAHWSISRMSRIKSSGT